MPFRYSYLAMKWPFISFIFLRLLFYSPNYFWQLFFFLLCFCISFTLTFQFSHLFYYSLLLFVGVILSYSLFSHFTSFPLRVLLSHILFWGQGRAGNIWQLHAQEICSVQCLNLCFFFGCYFRFLIRLSHASYCMTHLFIRSSYTQRLLHTYIEEFGERLYSVCTQVSWKYFPPLKT